MYCWLVTLVCFSVAVLPVLCLHQCIPEIIERIKALNSRCVLEQEMKYGEYYGCVVAEEPFDFVFGVFFGDKLNVTVRGVNNPEDYVRTYSFEQHDDCTYTQTNIGNGVFYDVYSIYACEHYSAKYGCCTQEGCGDQTHFVQCDFPKGANKKYYEECKEKLDEVVNGFFETQIICK